MQFLPRIVQHITLSSSTLIFKNIYFYQYRSYYVKSNLVNTLSVVKPIVALLYKWAEHKHGARAITWHTCNYPKQGPRAQSDYAQIIPDSPNYFHTRDPTLEPA